MQRESAKQMSKTPAKHCGNKFSNRNVIADFEEKEVRMARLLSVNVGLPREVTWNGKTVRTAVWKFPVKERRMVRKLNIAGHLRIPNQ
jgi:hypothetical protein